MENSPHLNESAEDDDDSLNSSGKKKKSAGVIGVYAVEPGATPIITTEKPKAPNLWEQIKAKKEESAPQASTSKQETVSEAEAPLEELSETEKTEITKQLVQQRIIESATLEASLPPEQAAVEQAVALFREKKIEGIADEQAEQQAIAAMPELADAVNEDNVPEESNQPETPAEFTDDEIVINRLAGVEDEPDDARADSPAPIANAVGSGSGGATPRSSTSAGSSSAQFGGAPGMNTAPTSAAASQIEYVTVPDRTREVGNLLIGGIIGYLIGRRRGRIRTEKKLLPIQRKLESQVKQLETDIVEREEHVRFVATQRLRARMIMEQKQSVESRAVLRRSAPEANALHHDAKVPPERNGHVLIRAESAVPERPAAERRGAVLKTSAEDVQTLSRADLLSLSEKITVEGSTLRQIYETNLISEKGLRRLVAEHLRGGNLQKLLRRELVEREIDFERDPILRDTGQFSSNNGGASTTSLGSLLLHALDEDPDLEAEDNSFLQARAKYEATKQQKQRNQHRVLDLSIGAVITVLLAFVVMLALNHH